MQLRFDVPPSLILLLIVLVWLCYGYEQRQKDENEDDPGQINAVQHTYCIDKRPIAARGVSFWLARVTSDRGN